MVLTRTDLSRGGALPAWPGSWSHENNLFRPVSILRHIPGWEGRGSVSSRPSLRALRGMSLAPRARERQGAAGVVPAGLGGRPLLRLSVQSCQRRGWGVLGRTLEVTYAEWGCPPCPLWSWLTCLYKVA